MFTYNFAAAEGAPNDLQWRVEYAGEDNYRIFREQTNQVLTLIREGSNTDVTEAAMIAGEEKQLWKLEVSEHGAFMVKSAYSESGTFYWLYASGTDFSISIRNSVSVMSACCWMCWLIWRS